MQFLHPEFFYALPALLIPILIHIFQLRRFKVQAFTNVALLQKIRFQTRKSSQLKKWLILLIRLLLIASIITAFTQPFLSNQSAQKNTSETVIYLDNSFSMQAIGSKGSLLNRAVQDVITGFDATEKIGVFTNSQSYKSTSLKDLKTELLSLKYSQNQLDLNTVILKGTSLFSDSKTSSKTLIVVSDFQQQEDETLSVVDTSIRVVLVPLKPINTANSYIESVALEPSLNANYSLNVSGKTNRTTDDPISVTLYQDQTVIGKSILEKSKGYKTTFVLPNTLEFAGKLSIEDTQITYDDTFYFNIPKAEKIGVLAIHENKNSTYLKKLYSGEEFIFQSQNYKTLDYSQIKTQNLIVLNGLTEISLVLKNSLETFMENGGVVVMIPSKNGDLKSYNQFLALQTKHRLKPLQTQEKRITNIAFKHPILKDVFEEQVTNFQYPKVQYYYPLTTSTNSVLSFEDQQPFLIQFKALFLFTAAVEPEASNFVNSPLIVPTFYNIGKSSLKTPPLYYWIGAENKFDIKINLQKDRILKLANKTRQFIPFQTNFNNKVSITTKDHPKEPGHFSILKDTDTLTLVSYNYNRNESQLNYANLAKIKGVSIENSLDTTLKNIKIEANVTWLWKWFVIFALILLAFEMLILKYFK
ncbi:BatA domain-containing protein [Flavobacteriaceae bacterium]|nr:BatA domain-containing protein [Flavobacteriaceae bacterium]